MGCGGRGRSEGTLRAMGGAGCGVAEGKVS